MNDKIKELKDLLFELDSKYSVSVPDTQKNINDVVKKIVKLFAIPDVIVPKGTFFCECELPTNNFELDTGEICCCLCEKELAK